MKETEGNIRDFGQLFLEKDAFARYLGIEVVETAKGYAKTRLEIGPEHVNGVGITHGGAVFTLADLAFAIAGNSHGIFAVAIEINVSYIKATQPGDVLTAEAVEVSLSRKLGIYSVTVTNGDGDIVATFQGTAYRMSPDRES